MILFVTDSKRLNPFAKNTTVYTSVPKETPSTLTKPMYQMEKEPERPSSTKTAVNTRPNWIKKRVPYLDEEGISQANEANPHNKQANLSFIELRQRQVR